MTRLKKIADNEIGNKDKSYSSKSKAIEEAKKRKSEVSKDDIDTAVDYIVYTPDDGVTYEIMPVINNENPGMPTESIVFCTCDM